MNAACVAFDISPCSVIGTSHFEEASNQYTSQVEQLDLGQSIFFYFFLFVCDLWCVNFIGIKCEFGVFFRVCCFYVQNEKKKTKKKKNSF